MTVRTEVQEIRTNNSLNKLRRLEASIDELTQQIEENPENNKAQIVLSVMWQIYTIKMRQHEQGQ